MDNCKPGTVARVLPRRHLEACESEACPGCLPCPRHHCKLCRRNHTDTTACPTCLAEVRGVLARLKVLATHLPDEAHEGRPAYRPHDGVPGGDALVLLVPGPDAASYRHALDERLARQLDTSHTLEEQRTDPRPVYTVLVEWVGWWRAQRHQTTQLEHTVPHLIDYLTDYLHEMARDDQFPTMSRDLASMLRQVEDALHDGERPETSRVPCWECGTRLVKVYTARLADDHWLCPHCGERYDKGRYDRAKHDHLASIGAARFVSISDATAAIGRPERTVRTWVARQQVESMRDAKTGRLLVWWPDVRNQHQATLSRLLRTRLG